MDTNQAYFSQVDFNQKFEQDKELTKQMIRNRERDRLEKLNENNTKKSIGELSVVEILVNMKDAWFETMDDLLSGKFNYDTFTKNNRLFYYGLTIIIVVIVIYISNLFI